MLGFSPMNYALIVIALIAGLMILTWRWKRLQAQNRALEEELRVLEPFNNPIPQQAMLPDELPRPFGAPTQPPSTAMPDASIHQVMTTKLEQLEQSDESDSETEEEAAGEAPLLTRTHSNNHGDIQEIKHEPEPEPEPEHEPEPEPEPDPEPEPEPEPEPNPSPSQRRVCPTRTIRRDHAKQTRRTGQCY